MTIPKGTLFKIKLLRDTAYNTAGDILYVQTMDEKGSVYYYDTYHRWCYLTADEEHIMWSRINR